MNNQKVPKIRFKGFSGDWEQRKFSDIYEKNNERNNGQFGWNRTISTSTMTFNEIGNGAADSSIDNYKILRVGDIAFEGHTNKEFRYGRFVLNDIGDGIMSPRFATLRPIIKQDLSFWKPYIHDERVMRKKLVRSTKAGTMMNELVIDDLMEQLILVPSLQEQKKIGAFFEGLDNLITLHQSKLDKLKTIKKSMLENCFPKNGEKVPKIRFSGFTDDWEQRKLGDLGTTFTGLSGKSKEDFGHGDAQFVTYMNVFTNPVSDTTMTEHVEIDNHQSKVQYGDVFFTTSSETPDEVGMSSVWLGNTDNIYLNSFCFGYRPEVNFDPYYMAYMLRSDVVRKNIIFLAQGISRYNISKNRVMDIEVPVPSLAEQKKIGSYFKNLDHLITLHQSKLDKLKVIKKTLLESMFV